VVAGEELEDLNMPKKNEICETETTDPGGKNEAGVKRGLCIRRRGEGQQQRRKSEEEEWSLLRREVQEIIFWRIGRSWS
jgi:hypothetical protein